LTTTHRIRLKHRSVVVARSPIPVLGYDVADPDAAGRGIL
jgi:hypothetical protein